MTISGQRLMWFGSSEDAIRALDEYPNGVVFEFIGRDGDGPSWAITDDALTACRWLTSGEGRIVNAL